ncbi:ATP-binding protein [Massilia sp. CFBP9012]|uniref:AAA family ATPase n=1 Tax=Massilia sp. CFBP9012 TaxID=3096531 RepID=UPI002A69E991|nr:AAA family ATPase [Massilia sp. CFBP9012]MDY0977734.1 ATP-binding protein [Massilia sp. CFBP9012]
MSTIVQRPVLAAQMAAQLIRPGPLDEGLRSGLFLSGTRRTGKTTFVLHDLIPALEQEGAIVIYVDLWSNVEASPATLVNDAVGATLKEAETAGSRLANRLAHIASANIGVFGLKLGLKLDGLGTLDGLTLAAAFTRLVDTAKTNVVLIVDEVQHAITTEEGNALLLALKAARDAINPRPGTPGYFQFIGAGSHRALVSELTARRSQAFAGATSLAFPMLGADYVDYLLARLHAAGGAILPSRAVAVEGFVTLGHRPEEMLRALGQLQTVAERGDPDALFPVIAATLRSAAADVELAKLAQLGGLATAVFERIAASDGDARGLFSADAAADYARVLGREVRVDEIQPAVNDLMDANLILRRGHGLYGLSDPYVQEIWRERRALTARVDR